MTFVSNVLDYLNEKREALKSSKEKDSIFSKDAQTEIRNELRNAIVVIQDIYERRERKILGQAVILHLLVETLAAVGRPPYRF